MKYSITFTIVSHEDADAGDAAPRKLAQREKRVLVSHPSEVSWHIALKILGLILYWEDSPQVELDVGHRHKPDLAVTETGPAGERVRLWIDCGNIAVRKIHRVAAWLDAEARFIILRRDRRDAEALLDALDAASKPLRNPVTVRWFEEGVVNALAEALDANNTLEAARGPETLALTLRGRGGTRELHTRMDSSRVG